jgi:hypothetical protein
MHTENSHLSQIITTFSTGLTALNGLTTQVQSFATGTSGTDFGISSATSTHTFNLPTASATNRGALSTTDWSAFNGKFNLPSLTNGSVLFSNGTTIAQDNAQLFWDDTNNRLGIGTASATAKLHIAAPGALSTDIALRVRNSADTADLFQVQGNGAISQSSLYNLNGTFFLNTTDTATNDYGPVLTFAGNYTGTTPVNFGMIRGAKSSVGGQRGYMSFHTGASGASLATESMRINWNNNILIGTIVDQGGRLQVKAPGALSTDIALRVRNSADTADLTTIGGTGIITTAGFTQNSGDFSTIISATNFSIYTGGGFILYSGRARFSSGLAAGNANLLASAILQADSTTQGFLPPRMTTTQKNAIATPATGLVVFDTTLNKLCVRGASAWETITSI